MFDGICGLLILNLYFYGNDAFMFSRPELLNYGFPAFLVDSPEKALPGI
ncbi:hypothetical protein [Sphingomonas sp. S-NIH.Pt15_0812]|nr:hypothetical protein [Sphingomonas sp. S-NIH.Pt15_0812]